MKICTFNVNSIKARKGLILEWLDHRSHDLDVLCFQELKTIEEDFPFEEFQKVGFECHAFGQKGYNGVAICTKKPARNIRKGFNDDAWDEQKRIISAQIQGIDLINVYAPHGDERGTEKFDYKQIWYKTLLSFLDGNFTPQDPLIVVGDLNVAHRDIDVYSPEALADTIGTMPEERAAFEGLLDWRLIDTYRHLNPNKRQYTWWDYVGGAIWKDEGMRIDYILCTASLTERIVGLEVDLWPRKRRTPTPSDHAPLIVELKL